MRDSRIFRARQSRLLRIFGRAGHDRDHSAALSAPYPAYGRDPLAARAGLLRRDVREPPELGMIPRVHCDTRAGPPAAEYACRSDLRCERGGSWSRAGRAAPCRISCRRHAAEGSGARPRSRRVHGKRDAGLFSGTSALVVALSFRGLRPEGGGSRDGYPYDIRDTHFHKDAAD